MLLTSVGTWIPYLYITIRNAALNPNVDKESSSYW